MGNIPNFTSVELDIVVVLVLKSILYCAYSEATQFVVSVKITKLLGKDLSIYRTLCFAGLVL